MNLIELKERIDNIIKYTRFPEDKKVYINLSQPSIGRRAGTEIESIDQGFDWEHNEIRIEPSVPLCTREIRQKEEKGTKLLKVQAVNRTLYYCKKCMTLVSKNDNYCKRCGTKIFKEEK